INFFNDIWIFFCNPTQTKKSGLAFMVIKNLKNPIRVLMNPRFIIHPFLFSFGRVIVKNMKPFFYIKGQYVHQKKCFPNDLNSRTSFLVGKEKYVFSSSGFSINSKVSLLINSMALIIAF